LFIDIAFPYIYQASFSNYLRSINSSLSIFISVRRLQEGLQSFGKLEDTPKIAHRRETLCLSTQWMLEGI